MKSDQPLVTVYITNFNYEPYVAEAITSVLTQSYQNIELIIIDDGSTDGSKSVIDRFEANNNIITVFQSNQGLTKTNNVALALAKGSYIVRLDADDRFCEHAISKLLAGFNNDKVAMVFGNWNIIDSHGNYLYTYKRHDFQKDVTLLDSPAHGACTMFRTDYLRQVGGYNEELLCQDGYELWFRIIEKFVVRNIDDIVFEYRRHGENLTGNEDRILSTRAKVLKSVAERRNRPTCKTFCVVPIRGATVDSRSRPFQKLGGKFLIDQVIEGIINSEVFSQVIVSTPDMEVVDYVECKYSTEVWIHNRQLDTSRINVGIDPVIVDILQNAFPQLAKFNYGMLLSVDRPFNKSHLFSSAISIASIFGVDNVIGVRPSSDVFFNHNGGSLEGINFSKSSLRLERNDLYQMVRGFNLFKVENVINEHSIWGDVIGHVVLDQKTSFCLESQLDTVIAESLLTNVEERDS